mgnify:CR=1 FL=1
MKGFINYGLLPPFSGFSPYLPCGRYSGRLVGATEFGFLNFTIYFLTGLMPREKNISDSILLVDFKFFMG